MVLQISITATGLLIQPRQSRAPKRRLEELRGFLKHHGKTISDEQLYAPVNIQTVLHTFDRNFCKAARTMRMTPEVRVVPVKRA